jgi:hypothetical protein
VKHIIAAASLVVALTTGASAEILCTDHGGCQETGMTIRLPSSPYRGVDTTVTSRANPNARLDARRLKWLDYQPGRSRH